MEKYKNAYEILSSAVAEAQKKMDEAARILKSAQAECDRLLLSGSGDGE